MKFLDEKQVLYDLLKERKEMTFSDITKYCIGLYADNKDVAIDLSRDMVMTILLRNPNIFKYENNRLSLVD